MATRLSVSSPLSAAVWRTPLRSPFQSMSWWNNSGWPFSKWPFPVWRRENVGKMFQKPLSAQTSKERQDKKWGTNFYNMLSLAVGESNLRVFMMWFEARLVPCLPAHFHLRSEWVYIYLSFYERHKGLWEYADWGAQNLVSRNVKPTSMMPQDGSHKRHVYKVLGKHKDRLGYVDWTGLTFNLNHSIQGSPVCEKPQVESLLKISRHILI